ncbi:MAG: hypothetical protein Q7R95_03170, partial [bacterium]|nr:hypothetical protein [bacterium]
MKIHRIYAVILRYTYTFMHSLNRMTDAFYWPFMDLLIWGLTISYINTISNGSGNVVVTVISGLLLWLVVWRGQYEISVNLLDDLWTKNLINMFVTPLQLSEWIVSVVLLGILKVVFSLGFAAIAAFILYRVALINYG